MYYSGRVDIFQAPLLTVNLKISRSILIDPYHYLIEEILDIFILQGSGPNHTGKIRAQQVCHQVPIDNLVDGHHRSEGFNLQIINRRDEYILYGNYLSPRG